jgi:hypothetical protein
MTRTLDWRAVRGCILERGELEEDVEGYVYGNSLRWFVNEPGTAFVLNTPKCTL